MHGAFDGILKNQVRLVRACGSKLYCHWLAGPVPGVRLVRACGSKHCHTIYEIAECLVRLVRACGSKLHKLYGGVVYEGSGS